MYLSVKFKNKVKMRMENVEIFYFFVYNRIIGKKVVIIMKKKGIIISLIMILIIIVLNIFNTSYAYTKDVEVSEIVKVADVLDPGQYDPNTTTAVTKETAGTLINKAGTILSLILIGIKYMVGSIEEKADYKKALIPYVIGAVFVFGITTIVTIIQIFMSNF